MMRMVRVGKWEGAPSRAARKCVATFVSDYFKAETVWTRKEGAGYVVVAQEDAKNTETLERFRFHRSLEERFRFRETEVEVEVALSLENTP